MNYDDFLRVDVDAFSEIYKAYHDREENKARGEWERMRLLATISIQPHIKKSITPQKLLPFSWDHENDQDKQVAPRRTMTASEQRERMKQLAESQGIEMA